MQVLPGLAWTGSLRHPCSQASCHLLWSCLAWWEAHDHCTDVWEGLLKFHHDVCRTASEKQLRALDVRGLFAHLAASTNKALWSTDTLVVRASPLDVTLKLLRSTLQHADASCDSSQARAAVLCTTHSHAEDCQF